MACSYILYMHIPSFKNGLMSFLLKNGVICSPQFQHSLALWTLLHVSTFLVNDHRWSTSPWRVTPLCGGNNPALAPIVSSSSEASTSPQTFPFAISELLLLPQTLSAVSCLCLYYMKIYASRNETYHFAYRISGPFQLWFNVFWRLDPAIVEWLK